MKKKIIIITISIIIILVILIVSFGFYQKNSNPNNIDNIKNIITKNDYGLKLTNTIPKGTESNGYVYDADCYLYRSDDLNIFVYDYEDYPSAKDTLLVIKGEREHESKDFEYVDQENHSEFNICVENNCVKNVAFSHYLVSIHYMNEKEYIHQTEEIINKLLEATKE